MSTKFEIDQLEDRIAPSAVAVGGSAGLGGTDVSVTLPILGTVSVGVDTSGLTIPNLPIVGGLLGNVTGLL